MQLYTACSTFWRNVQSVPRSSARLCVAACLCLILEPIANAALPQKDETGPRIVFLARPVQPLGGYGGASFSGHAFIIVEHRLNATIKEEAFGFYPLEGGKGQLKGPGMLRGLNRCSAADDCSKPKYADELSSMADVVVSERVRVTEDQLRSIYKVFDRWATKDFSLTDSNCVSFLSDVLKAAGYDPPPNTGMNRFPTVYVGAIQQAVAAQDKLREERLKVDKADERRVQAERERDAAVAERKRAEQEAKAARVAAAEANAIPAGWVACNCPNAHSGFGKVVDRVRWHAPNLGNCP